MAAVKIASVSIRVAFCLQVFGRQFSGVNAHCLSLRSLLCPWYSMLFLPFALVTFDYP